MEYLPFGELLVEEHLSSYNSPFKFNAKEYDAETGNYYYGARYFNPKWSIWLSVDPLANFYPEFSPYIYTYNNPIRWRDFMGLCPEGDCPEGVEAGTTHPSKDGATYTYDGKNWSIDERGALDEVVLTAKRSAEIPSSETNQGEAISWNGCNCTLDEWNSMNGTNFTSHQEAYNWWVQNKKQAEVKAFVASMQAGQRQFIIGAYDLTAHLFSSTGAILQDAGDYMMLGGVTATASGLGAPIGLPMIAIGKGTSMAGGVLTTGGSLMQGDWGGVAINSSSILIGRSAGKLISKSGLDSFSRGLIDASVNLKINGAVRLLY